MQLGCQRIKIFPVIGRLGLIILPLADHVAQLHTFQGSPGSLGTLESQHELCTSLNAPVILLFKYEEERMDVLQMLLMSRP